MAQAHSVLVTGASGFVGQALVRRLLAQGRQVTALVRDTRSAPPGSTVLVHGLGSGQALILPPDVDAVIHLAQSRSYRSFPGDAAEMFAVNVAGAHEVLLAAAAAKVSRFCLVSSGTVYDPFVEPMEEGRILAPSSNLGVTKLASEVLAQSYSTLFPISILRLFAPYGPGQTARLIPDLIGRVRRGDAVTLPPNGGGMLFTPTYVDDVCGVLLAAIDGSWTGTFNVASPEVLSVEDVARAVGAALGVEPRFERKEMNAPSLIPPLARLVARYDVSRFRRFADGVAATVASEL